MKDGDSFDVDDQTAETTYEKMYDCYQRIFSRCGLTFRAVQADSGTIGGSFSHEFMVLAATGEDTIVVCNECEYAANMEKAEVAPVEPTEDAPLLEMEKVETPGKRKVKVVCEFMGISPHELVKTMVYLADGEPVAVLLRGDRQVEEVKLKNLLGVVDVEPADDKQLYEATGVPSGYLGPVGITIKVVADQEVATMRNFVIGANEKNFHLKNVNLGRDFQVAATGDLRRITEDDPCPSCGGGLQLTEGIEVGHIFKLGTGYSRSMQALFQDSDGQEKPFVMGCYGIGISRIVAAAIEQNHDRDGIIFPVPLAPFQVIILNLGLKDETITRVAEDLYHQLKEQGIDVLLDDRDERPGFKFKDADLLGIPFRLTVGKRLTKDGVVELRRRRDGHTEDIEPDRLVENLQARLAEEMPEA